MPSPPLSRRGMLSSGGASQPAGGTASTVDLNVGCFNIGIAQAMLQKSTHIQNFRRIVGKGFEEGDLHLLGLCEVGDHKKGLEHAGIYLEHLINGVLRANEYSADSVQAYMSVWHEAGAAQPGGVSLQLSGKPKCVALDPPALDPQLVIWDF